MGGGGEGGVRSRVTLCLSSRLDPVKVPVSEVTPKRERAQCYSERGEDWWCLSSTNSQTLRGNKQVRDMAIAWSAPTYSSHRQDGGVQGDTREVRGMSVCISIVSCANYSGVHVYLYIISHPNICHRN